MRKNLMFLGAVCCLLAAAALFSVFGGREVHVERSFLVMDTVVTLSADGRDAEAAVEECLARLKEIELLCGPKSAELKALEEAAGKGPVAVSSELFDILTFSQEYSEKTDGAWDVTMGPLIRLWGIGTEHARVPSDGEIAKARALVGWRQLHLDREKQTAFLEKKGMSLDLGGIAKGYALDELRKIYEAHGIKKGLINLGASSLYAVGRKGENAWRIGIKHPRSEERDACLAIVSLEDEALSTSGDYERVFEENGKRYHHILNPKTGCPAETGAICDTVILRGSMEHAGMLSDMLSTAVFVMGPEKGQKLLETLPEEVQGAIVSQDRKLFPVHGMEERMERLAEGFSYRENKRDCAQ